MVESLPGRPFRSWLDEKGCGEVHPRGCHSHRTGSGVPCGNPPAKGQDVCKYHGGNAPQAIAAAERRMLKAKTRARAEAQARRIVNLGYANPSEPFDPIERLIELCRWKAAEIEWLRGIVVGMERGDLVWGRTEQEAGYSTEKGTNESTTFAAGPNVWWQLLREAESQYATWLGVLMKADVDQRRLHIAEGVGAAVVGVLRAVQGDVLSAMLAAGIAEEVMVQVFQRVYDESVRRHMVALRSAPAQLSGGKGES